ncbi:MAG TPA: cobaltochelatase subunit CobN [Chloroflexi bacterium]|nr:cobaltochelatase subunit CobN [Chloroflexota bacterium]
MTEEIRKRNMVERLDGRMVNAGRLRGMLSVCASGCCCGHTERGFAPVEVNLYHTEWERRKLRNKVHLSQGGCLGPCVLANVALLLMDGRPYWFHSINDAAIVRAIYDFIELLINDANALPPTILRPHLFNGFGWDGTPTGAAQPMQHTTAPAPISGSGILLLTQADTDLLTLTQARRKLPVGFAPVDGAHIGRLPDEAAIDALLDAKLPAAQIVVVRVHSSRSFEHGLERLQRWAAETDGMLLCLPAVEAFDPDLMARSTVGIPLTQAISAYFQCGGVDNLVNGLQCLSDHLLVTGWGFEQPQELLLHGVYEAPIGCCACSSTEVCLTAGGQPPTVGILFYRSHLLSGNTEFVDAIIQALHAHGLTARAIYTQSLKEYDEEGMPVALKLMQASGPVDVIISTLSFALSDKDAIFTQIDAPILQAITSSSDLAAWRRNGRGLSPLDTAMNVAIPEFDGRIIAVPISFKEETEDGGARYAPHDERIERLAALAARLIALRRKPNAQKRIAVVFTNSAAKAARVGNAVGLDAPASLLALLHRMQAEGYVVENAPASSDELMLNLIDRCSYDATWLTDAQLARAYHLPVSRYAEWYAAAPASSRHDMERQWGAPPGKAYTHAGNFALAGLEYGNVFVALQPPRGYDLNPDEVYHRPDLPPPHNYFALYRWLRDEWGADAIIHMGKHGTLEWLPGKSVGLSESCFPDLFLGDLPLIYPFIINDPGEGSQAKRRSHAVIVDHMTPPMTSAGAYGALAELAQLVDEYYTAEQLDPAKLPLLQRQIWDVIERNRLDDDLRYILKSDHGDHAHDWDGAFLEDGAPTAFAELQGAQVAHLLEDIEGYLCELTGAQIRDGLHILGYLPQDEQLIELLYHLLKLPNLQAPSLPVAVAASLGEDWGELQQQPGARRLGGQAGRPGATQRQAALGPIQLEKPVAQRELYTNADLIDVITGHARALLRQMAACGWDSSAAEEVAATWAQQNGVQHKAPTAALEDIASALRYACHFIVPRLREGAQAEIDHLIHALNGGYIPPGPSGAPTRGMAHVLPTGRNFYSVDPRALPTMASWQVGQGLAENLLARYRREEGGYPESVGISIWGTSAMRTAGDDIAQVLALLGVRPVWRQENRRVTGIELIPLAELGRPRIDVVCRISGFFRDAFPHLITLLDNAIQTVIDADEPLDQNFPRKHTLLNEAALRLSGHNEAAPARARYRIFGCKPGSYGAGILPLIDAKNWQSDADFARAYLTWGGYAYSATEQGAPAQDEFAAALKTVQVATKNQDNREHDIFDSDDYLQYHGGMIATVRALTGKNPRRYFGDSSDPARVQTRDLREEARRVFRSRVINPKWLASMRRHGYKGALEIAATVDYLFGYDATAQVLEDWMYHNLTEEFLRNEEMQQFFAESNPWAWQAIAERLLEAVERGLWQDPDPTDMKLLNAAKELGLAEIRRRAAI